MTTKLDTTTMTRCGALVGAFAAFVAASRAHTASGAEMTAVDLDLYNVTIRVFDPNGGATASHEYVLPVKSPDAEHAVSSTMANAVSFTTKTQGTNPLPVAFTCVRVERAS